MPFRVVHVSDTHMSHWELDMPVGDILVHTGDFSGYGSERELIEFNNWLGSLEGNYREIFVVPGNHDKQFENFSHAESLLTNAVVLFDKMVEFGGYKIYGSPWTCEFFNWSFMKKRGPEIKEMWDKIPDDVEILLTHQPPHMFLDSAEDMKKANKFIPVGCKDLRDTCVTRLKKLKLNCFGHLHRDGGKMVEHNGIIYCNGAVNNDNYRVTRGPMIIDFE
jgi:Icc-related predicted phosphoesterase